MLDDDIARRSDGNVPGTTSPDNSVPLLTGFLNPPEFFHNGTGTYTPEQAAGAVMMGSSDQTGNELDEFINETLRNNLLGLPLDLATLNMTRARDAGIPPLNDMRRDIFGQTNDGQLAPYTSWSDFGQHLKHPESLINFVAAYGQHSSITSESTLAGKRAAAKAIVDPAPGGDPLHPTPGDAADFMFSTGAWANTETGLNLVDLWVGGLAEVTNLNGGLLGSTMNYVFQSTLENLQDGDRFYYLNRTPGMNLRTQLESNSFSELVQRNTDGTHTLKADAFATADCKFELANLGNNAASFTGANPSSVADDPTTDCDENALLLRKPDGTIQYKVVNSVDPSGINGQSVYNGDASVNRVFGGVDNDTFWGGAGNDIIEGNNGDDVALGGDGNDILTDLGGADVSKGGPGNDAIDGGIGDDIFMGGDGQDFGNGGQNDNESFMGEGNDFVIAGAGADATFGDGGDDWIEGGSGQDLLQGDHAAPFFDDPAEAAPGNDLFVGQVGENDYDAEGGDDVMAQNAAIDRNAGAGGFDWAFHQYDTVGGDDDLLINANLNGVPLPVIVNRDRWQETEADSGSPFNDTIRGDSFVPNLQGGDAGIAGGFTGCDALDAAGVARIQGLNAIITPAMMTVPAAQVAHVPGLTCPLSGNTWGAGNILIGGGGSDLIEGRGADDVIDGDRALSIGIQVRTAPNGGGTLLGTTDLMEHQYLRDGAGNLTGPTLQQAVFAGTVDPGNLQAVRSIASQGAPGDADTALFSGPRANYTVSDLTISPITVTDNTGVDGTDTLYNIEKLQFTDQTISIVPNGVLSPTSLAFGSTLVGQTTPTQTVTITNQGGQQPLNIATVTVAGTDPTQFQRTGGTCANGTSLTTNQSCTVIMRFAPTGAAGARSAILRFNDNHNGAAGTNQDVPMTGTALANQPVAGVSPASLTFAARNVGSGASATQNVTLSNTGNAPLAISNIAFTGPSAGQYQRVAPTGTGAATCAAAFPANLAAGASCRVGVAFNPTVVGATPNTFLTFTDDSGNAAGATQSVSLSGTGNAVAPVASLTGSLAFGNQQTGTSATRTATLANTGSATMSITNIAVSGAGMSRQGGTCATTFPANLAAGGSCTIIVRFLPTALGTVTGALTVTDNAAGSPHSLAATGTGVGAAISVTPNPLAFGNTTRPGPLCPLICLGGGKNLSLTVTNTGSAGSALTVTLPNPPITGTNATMFSVQSNGCTSSLAAGATCTISVRFLPTSTGSKTATLQINSNAPTTPTLVSLTGTGV